MTVRRLLPRASTALFLGACALLFWSAVERIAGGDTPEHSTASVLLAAALALLASADFFTSLRLRLTVALAAAGFLIAAFRAM